ncbi:MAG: hypothetical protein EPN97_18435 [Alphaproteobacteria bacterium]|nr:MAG: hypothetical protein EPN97_18435 [Alphaproteobacteria bacterium]
MSQLAGEFTGKAQHKEITSYREIAADPLSHNSNSLFKGMFAGAVDMGASGATDVLPVAAIVWDKLTDRFSICFPHNGEEVVHRLCVHFFHDGYEPVKDSSSFKPVADVLAQLPQLAGKEFSISPRGGDRIIDNLTHAQLEAIIESAQLLNAGLKEISDYRKSLDAALGLAIDNAFPNKAPAPAAAPPAPKKPAPKRKR